MTTYEYDNLGRTTTVTLPDPDAGGPLLAPAHTTTFDLVGNEIVRMDPMGNSTTNEFDNLYRLIRQIQEDPDGPGPQANPVTTYVHDAADQLLSVTDPMGRTTKYEYDGLGRQVQEALPDPDGPSPLTSPIISHTYDAVGNETRTVDPLGNVKSFEFDNLHRLSRMTDPDPDGPGPQPAPVTIYDYDLADQLLSVTNPLGRITNYEYDNQGHMTRVTEPDPDGAGPQASPFTISTYDAVGNLLAVEDALGQTTSYTYDNLFRQTAQIDADGAATQFAYDAVGNLRSLTDPVGNTTEWVYDGLNRVIEETNQSGDARYLRYDPVGNPVQTIDRNGRVIEYQFDNLYRATEERWKNGTSTIRTISSTYDLVGQMLTVSDPDASFSYAYDDLGRLTSLTQQLSGLAPVVVLSNEFDAGSRRTSVITQIGITSDFRNDYVYDALDRLSRIIQTGQTGGNAVAPKRVGFTYDPANQWDTINRFADLVGTTTVAESVYHFDDASRLTGLTHSSGTTPIADYQWTYDGANRMTRFVSFMDGTVDYTYDDRDQLTSANYDYQSDESYSYDDNGNRINPGYTTGNSNRLLSDGVFNYEHDAEGNRTKRTKIATEAVTEYEWDHRNRLTKVIDRDSATGPTTNVSELSYDHLNRWVKRSVDPDGDGLGGAQDTFFVYDEDQIILHFDGPAAEDLTHRYLWGPVVDQILADEKITSLSTEGETIWPLTDHLGTVRDLIQSNGELENHITYDAYGNVTHETNATVDHIFGFTGRPFDQSTAVQNNVNRWYDPQVGSWMSEDPAGLTASGVHLYRYGNNSPTNFVDPLGLEPWTWGSHTSTRSSDNGTWRVKFTGRQSKEVYDQSTNRNVPVSPRVIQFRDRQAIVDISFTPSKKLDVQAAELSIIQIARVTRPSLSGKGRTNIKFAKTSVDADPIEARRKKWLLNDMMTGSGWFVDHFPGTQRGIPFYSSTTNGSSISIHDEPGLSSLLTSRSPDYSGWRFEFETYAVCPIGNGPQDYQVVGGIKWGYTIRRITVQTELPIFGRLFGTRRTTGSHYVHKMSVGNATNSASDNLHQAITKFNAFHTTNYTF